MALYQDGTEISSEMVRQVQAWWNDHAGAGLPARQAFQPFDFKPLLPHLMIIDVEHDPFRIRYRLVGTRVVDATGLDFTGRYLDELDPVNEEEPWLDHYKASFAARRPVFGMASVKTMTGARFAFEFGLFPVTTGAGGVDQFLAVEDYFNFAHLFPDLPHWRVAEKRVLASADPA